MCLTRPKDYPVTIPVRPRGRQAAKREACMSVVSDDMHHNRYLALLCDHVGNHAPTSRVCRLLATLYRLCQADNCLLVSFAVSCNAVLPREVWSSIAWSGDRSRDRPGDLLASIRSFLFNLAATHIVRHASVEDSPGRRCMLGFETRPNGHRVSSSQVL